MKTNINPRKVFLRLITKRNGARLSTKIEINLNEQEYISFVESFPLI